jgi:hypothetical protein
LRDSAAVPLRRQGQGEALYAAGRYAEAEPRWREVLVRAERELGPEHPGTAGLLGNLAALYRQEGCTDEAGALQAGGLDRRASVPALTGGSPRPPCSVRYRDTPQFSRGIAESVIRRWGSPSANARPETPDRAVGRGARPGPINP